MEDPRVDRTKRHKLIDILTIAICAVICGADSWVGIELYGCTKYDWLKTFLESPNVGTGDWGDGRLLRQGKRLKVKGKRDKFNLSPFPLTPFPFPMPHAPYPT
jgi:hypothetical protein